MRYFVRVFETVDDNGFAFSFLCATHAKSKEEAFEKTAIECLFRDKGHRSAEAFFVVNDDITIDVVAGIAAKKAELITLSKAEKSLFTNNGKMPFHFFALVFLFCGAVFGTLFSSAMMLMDKLLSAGEPVNESVSWIKVGVFSGLIFGLLFVVIYAILYKLRNR